ncbi:MAG: polyphosphate glucokinase [Micrococcales bacterium 73-13]|nr:MAG: polyphosphate glucokinase [Micrococcales bacterium 73-13]
MTHALGIDIGGTGIKGAVVDTLGGTLLTDRRKLLTPAGGEPRPMIDTAVELVAGIPGAQEPMPVGIAFPTIVKRGRTLSAGNISSAWIGLDGQAMFAAALGRPVLLVNDADAAGYAELHFGAAKDVPGLVILTTLGTGIGSAFIYDGVLVPNTEFGFLEIDGEIAEARASYRAKEQDELDWEQWAKRLQRFYTHLERVFSPDLFIVGGGVSKHADEFLPLLRLSTPIVTATHRNNAGILGAAAIAAAAIAGAAPAERRPG